MELAGFAGACLSGGQTEEPGVVLAWQPVLASSMRGNGEFGMSKCHAK
jgi:hypothetical protein